MNTAWWLLLIWLVSIVFILLFLSGCQKVNSDKSVFIKHNRRIFRDSINRRTDESAFKQTSIKKDAQ